MSRRDSDDRKKKKIKSDELNDNDNDEKMQKYPSSIRASDDEDIDQGERKSNKKLNLIDAGINYQIELLNQAQNKYRFLMRILICSKNTLFFAVNKPINDTYQKSNCFTIKAYPYQTDSEIKNVDKEIQIVYTLSDSKSIIKYIDSFQDFYFNKHHMFLVMPYYEKLDLMEEAHQVIGKIKEFVSFPEEDICQIAFQALNILKLLKDRKIVHNNIKLENILLKTRKPIRIVLTDFEFADVIEKQLSQNFKGFPYTHAPEVLEHKPHDTSADIWSLGFLLYQLLAKTNPFYLQKEMNEDDVLGNITYEKLEKFDIPDIPYNLISQMLELDPTKRISVENALQSKWFDGIEVIDLDVPDIILDTKGAMSELEKTISDSENYRRGDTQ